MNSRSVSRPVRRWESWPRADLYTGLVIVAAFFVQISGWPRLPIFMDCYYHLAVMRGFEQAGGWVGTAFWEYVPAGRPHLYPPLFHFLEMLLARCGIGPILVARLFQFLVYPFFLAVMAWFLKSRYNSRIAFWATFLFFSSASLQSAVLIYIPSTLAFLMGFMAYGFLEQRRPWSAALMLALVFYMHALIGVFFLGAFFFYGFWRRPLRRDALVVAGAAALAASPWLWHIARYASYLSLARVVEFYDAQINIPACLLALAGFWVCWRRRERYAFFISLFIFLLPMFFVLRGRFFSGQGMFLFIPLAAIFLDEVWGRWSARPVLRRWLTVFFVILFYGATPALKISLQGAPRLMLEERWKTLFPDDRPARDQALYYPRFMDPVARVIRDQLSPEDVFYTNYPYMGGLLSVLSDRATSNAMLIETRPFYEFDPIAAARLVVWFKEPEGGVPAGLSSLVASHGLKLLAETEVVYFYLNERASGRVRVLPAAVRTPWVFLILGGAAGVFFWEAFFKKNKG